LAADELAFQEAIMTVLRNPVLRQQMSNAASKWAATFSWEKSAASTLQLLDLSVVQQPVYARV
jgi:glycosyltransferase involved in cell wall biosynthesis